MSVPSEIIADEYIHTDNSHGSVYIFSDNNNKDNLKGAKKAFQQCGFNIPEEHLLSIDSKENVLKSVDNIVNENHKDTSCFILLFLGTIDEKDEEYITTSGDKIQGSEIWGKLMNCTTLKYRPKIFIFHGFRKVLVTTQVDAKSFKKPIIILPNYDIPLESDVLVMYKVTEGNKADSVYFQNLWENIKQLGSRDDLTNIIAYTKRASNDAKYPITVSTLRKKFYISKSQFRLDWYDINETTKHMMSNITKLQGVLHNNKSQSHYNGRSLPGSCSNSVCGDERMRKPDYSKIKAKVNSFRKQK